MAAAKYRIFLIVSSFLLCLFLALPVQAAEKVRVGCVDIGDFIQIDQDGYAIGYGADYLNKIAEYTGWEYEYIQAPWGECLDMLRRGELDLLLPAEYSEERARISFSAATSAVLILPPWLGASRTNVCIMMITTGSREYG